MNQAPYIPKSFERSHVEKIKQLLHKEFITLLFCSLNIGAFWIGYTYAPDVTYYDSIRRVTGVMLHVIPIVSVALLYLSSKISHNTFSSLMGISRGYLLYDVPMMYLFPSAGDDLWANMLYTLHHVIFAVITYYTPKYAKYIAIGLLSEIATLPLHYVLTFYHDDVVSSTPLFMLMAIALLLTYLLFRVINFCVLSYWMLQAYKDSKATWWEAVMLLPLCAMNCWWFFRLVEGAMSKYA